jgi:hypothetical protein
MGQIMFLGLQCLNHLHDRQNGPLQYYSQLFLLGLQLASGD